MAVYPKVPPSSQAEKKPPKYQHSSGDTAISTTPPGSPPPPPPLPEPPASSSVLKILSSLKPGATNTVTVPTVPAAVTGAASSASKSASPLEHILQTLFGKKKSFDPLAVESVESASTSHPDTKAKAECELPAAPLLDPIVQQFGQLSKEKVLEEEEDDRPYDPEEEYGPDRAFETQLGDRGKRQDMEKVSETTEREEVAYDPEDETILEEAKVAIDDLPNRMCADVRSSTERPAGFAADMAAPSLVEQQQMIEELNKQIEEQKRQVEEQEEALRQQRAAVGVSMAHFSVSDALMSPPPKSSLPKAELFPQEQQAAGRPAGPPTNQGPGPGSDPRQSRDPRQARRLATESNESESSKAPSSSTPGALPTRETPSGVATTSQGPVPAPEEKEPTPPPWVPGDGAILPTKQDGPTGEPSESQGPPTTDSSPSMTGGPVLARPARKVLLPTPPSTAFQPNFSMPGEGHNFSSAGRDPFSSPAFASQDKSFSSSPYEDPRNALFAEKSDRSAVETEGDRDPQCRPGEGASPFPPPGQKVPPLPQLQGQREPAPRTFGTLGLHGPSFPAPRGPVAPFSGDSTLSNDGARGPPPARFGAQKGPIPSLFSGPHGPLPYGDNRGPSPSHPGGPRGSAPPQFEERKDLHGEKREFQDAPYNDMAGPPAQFEGPEQGPLVGSRGAGPFQFGGPRRPLLAPFKGSRGGPPPSQFGGQRGPPPGHFVGPRGPHSSQFENTRGPHPNQFDGPRGQAPNFMPGPRGIQPQQFEEQRVNSPPRFSNQRAPAPLQFGGPRGSVPFPDKSEPAPPRFHFQGQSPQGMKPGPRPLLELPSHPPQHRKDRWDETGPTPNLPSGTPGPAPEAEAQWAPSKGPEYRNQAGPKEKPLDEPEVQPESRQGRTFEDRRREREHGKPWERERSRNWSRERDWDRGREWDRHREKDSSRERNANRDREREWDRSRERSRNRDRDRDRDRDRRRDRDRSRSRDRDRDKGRDHERSGDRKDRSKSKESTRDPKAEALAPRATDPAAHT